MGAKRQDLRTRVAGHVFNRVRQFACAHNVSVYQATERLVLLGLASLEASKEDKIHSSLQQLAVQVDHSRKVAERAAFGAFVAYSFGRHSALNGLSGEVRKEQDRKLLEAGQAAFERQINKAFDQ